MPHKEESLTERENMTIKCYSSIRSLLKYDEVFAREGHPFQRICVLAGVTNIVNRVWGVLKGFGHIKFYVVYKDGTPIIVVPLYVKAGIGRVIGSGRERMDCVDFLYNAKLKEHWEEALNVLMATFKQNGITKIVADFVSADSPLLVLKKEIEKTGETLNSSISLKEFPSHAD